MRILLILIALAAPLSAATLQGNPSNYTTQLAALQPGDTLQLAAGTYTNRLVINGMDGTSADWITIEGPTSGTATFNGVSGNNTVSLRDCSYIAIRNITIDCLGLAVDGIKAEGYTTTPHTVHDMLIEGCTILNAGANQQIVGINTKCPCWNWTIRGNTIIGAGTGMYLGNSTGDDPFARGVIEGNRVYDPEGYCIEIKHQNNWPAGIGLPTGAGKTILRNNVFIKTSRASAGDRPNLLVSGFPDSGDGSNDMYEIYGNFIANNPRESLIQACGRVSIHDNVLVDAPDANFAGIYIRNHQGKTLKVVHVYNNTVYSAARGIRVVEQPSVENSVQGNLVFSGNPISSGFGGFNQTNNITDTVANAGNYVANPGLTAGSIDFYPLAGQCTGAALTMTAYTGDNHYDLDFNGDSKGSFTYRGAYAGSGTNPGWALSNTLKTGGPGSGPTTPPALAMTNPPAGALADADVSASYSRTFTAAGGTGPYTWSVPAIDLPPGLALNTNSGVLSGVPTVVGPYSFTVTVTDSLSATDSRAYTLQIVQPATGGPPGSGGSGGGGCAINFGAGWWLLALPLRALLRRRE
jgi:Synergist-CTERM protein sorting domain-containing protein